MKPMAKGLVLSVLGMLAGCLSQGDDSLPPERPAGKISGTAVGFDSGRVVVYPLDGAEGKPLASARVEVMTALGRDEVLARLDDAVPGRA